MATRCKRGIARRRPASTTGSTLLAARPGPAARPARAPACRSACTIAARAVTIARPAPPAPAPAPRRARTPGPASPAARPAAPAARPTPAAPAGHESGRRRRRWCASTATGTRCPPSPAATPAARPARRAPRAGSGAGASASACTTAAACGRHLRQQHLGRRRLRPVQVHEVPVVAQRLATSAGSSVSPSRSNCGARPPSPAPSRTKRSRSRPCRMSSRAVVVAIRPPGRPPGDRSGRAGSRTPGPARAVPAPGVRAAREAIVVGLEGAPVGGGEVAAVGEVEPLQTRALREAAAARCASAPSARRRGRRPGSGDHPEGDPLAVGGPGAGAGRRRPSRARRLVQGAQRVLPGGQPQQLAELRLLVVTPGSRTKSIIASSAASCWSTGTSPSSARSAR